MVASRWWRLLLPFNSDGRVEAGSDNVEAGSGLPTTAWVLHVVDLGGGSFPSPFNSDGSVKVGSGGLEAQSSVLAAVFPLLHLYMNSSDGVGLPMVALQLRHWLPGVVDWSH